MTTQWQSATEKEMASVLLQGPRRANYYSAHVPCPGNPPGCRKKGYTFLPVYVPYYVINENSTCVSMKNRFWYFIAGASFTSLLEYWMWDSLDVAQPGSCALLYQNLLFGLFIGRETVAKRMWDTFVWRVYSSRLNIAPILNPFSSQAPLEQFFCDTLLWFIHFHKKESLSPLWHHKWLLSQTVCSSRLCGGYILYNSASKRSNRLAFSHFSINLGADSGEWWNKLWIKFFLVIVNFVLFGTVKGAANSRGGCT